MRNFLVLVAILATALLVPAAAEAHHLQQDTSSIVCVLDHNAPTVKVSADYQDFGSWDLPVYWRVSIDGKQAGAGALNWGGGDFRHNASFVTTPGTHDVVYQASWNQGDNGGYLSRRGLICPAPPPPPVRYGCDGKPIPAGMTPPTCTTTVVVPPPTPPPAPPCACPAPKPPAKHPACKCRTRIVIPHARHGVRAFGAHLLSRGKIVQTTMRVRAVGQGRSCLNGRCLSHPVHWRGGIGHVWLYETTIWRHRLAWGQYKISFTFKVRVTDADGTVHFCTCRRTVRFFNHDPGGLPS